MSYLNDDMHLSGEFIAIEAPDSTGHKQSLWIRVAPVFHDSGQVKAPTVQICYQQEHMGSEMTGPVFLDPHTWRALADAVEWRLRWHESRSLPLWRRVLLAFSR